jgi:Ala-tRNA(Pro) deacylase
MDFLAEVERTLNELNIPFRTIEHPAVFTVEESMKHIEDKIPIKNLLLTDKDHQSAILVIMSGAQRLDIKLVARLFETKKLSFADETVLKERLGVTPGSVSLFSLLHQGSDGIQIAIDKNLLKADELGFHPNDNTRTVYIPGNVIEQFVKHTGHKYKVVTLY